MHLTEEEAAELERRGFLPSAQPAAKQPRNQESLIDQHDRRLAHAGNSKVVECSEKQFTAQVIAFARSHGWKVAHFRCVRVQRKNGSTHYETPVQADGAGFPDLLLVRQPRVLVAELKVGNNRPTPEQMLWLSAFADTEVVPYIWRPEHWPEIKNVLR